MNDPSLDARANILGGLNVCRAAIESGCEQVLYVNTGGALYGEPDYVPCDEDHPIRPVSSYGLSKWTSECYFRLMLPDIDTSEGYAVSQRVRPKAKPARRVGSNSSSEENLANLRGGISEMGALLRHNKAEPRRLVLNFGTGKGTSVEVFRQLQAITGYDASPIYAEARDVRHIAHSTKAKEILGWARVGLLEGLEDDPHAGRECEIPPRLSDVGSISSL